MKLQFNQEIKTIKLIYYAIFLFIKIKVICCITNLYFTILKTSNKQKIIYEKIAFIYKRTLDCNLQSFIATAKLGNDSDYNFILIVQKINLSPKRSEITRMPLIQN